MGHLRAAAVALLAITLAACGDSSGAAKSSGTPDTSEGGLLFVLGAPGARLERDASGAGRLVLQDPSTSVTSFTDRPERSANTLALADFVADWPRYGFAAVPPNAALVVEGAAGNADVAVFEIASPRLEDGALSFDVVPVAAEPSTGLRALAERADPSLPSELGRVSLFVDDASSPVTYQQIVLQIADVQPGQAIRVTVSAANDAVGWSLGSPDGRAPGVSLTCEAGSSLPLTQMVMDPQSLVLFTTSDGGGASSVAFEVTAYLVASGPVSLLSLASTSDAGVTVTAAIGDGSPVVLDETPTELAWGQ